MVAHLLKLKLQLLGNGLRRSVAAIVGLVVGILYGGGLVVLALVGLVALRFQDDLELTRTVVVLGGSALLLAWAVVPVLLFGVDPTLDPGRFATFSVPERQLAVGLMLAGLIGLPGIATVLLALTTVVTWSHGVPGVLVAATGATLGVLACVLLSRILTSAASAMLQTRRGKDLLAVAGFVALVVFGPALSLVSNGGFSPSQLGGLADALAWSPLGWAWAAPADAVAGQWAAALLRLGLAALLAGVLFAVWQRQLASAVRNPRGAASSQAQGAGRAGLGLFGALPGTPLGAVAARSATYWRRDPRFTFPAIITALVPIGLLVAWHFTGSDLALAGMPLVSAYMLGWGQHNDVGYDSTAFWMHVAAGVDGASDRLGRLFPSAVLAVVCIPLYAVLGAAVGGSWGLLPATLGVSAALLLTGFAVASVISAIKQYPVPGPGESPFATPPGGAGLTMLIQALVAVAVLLLSSPALVLGALAWFGHGWASWTALVVGPALGAAILALGIRVGGRTFERRAPELLQDLTRVR